MSADVPETAAKDLKKKVDLAREYLDALAEAIDAPAAPAAQQPDKQLAVRPEPAFVNILSRESAGQTGPAGVVDMRKDVLGEYLQCLQNLCSSCGGFWDWGQREDDAFAGCHFDSNAAAALYAALAWTCLPDALIHSLFGMKIPPGRAGT